MSVVRQTTAVVSALVALGLGAAACGGQEEGSSAQSGEPVKIGVLLPYTGPFGLYGKPMEAALRQRIAEAGGTADGRPVELLFEDEATD
ncbi:MAG TPA: ABC transporter substrate-binding protein, partial [Solirubrobacter sp.]|nr:ABC transporter substrate-binding protein [Solirubrobacter sp.]